MNHAEMFSVYLICGPYYWSYVWLAPYFPLTFTDTIFIITGTWGLGTLMQLISKVNLKVWDRRQNWDRLSLNFQSYTSRKKKPDDRKMAILCRASGAFLYLGKLLFKVSTSVSRVIKGTSIQGARFNFTLSFLYFTCAACAWNFLNH